MIQVVERIGRTFLSIWRSFWDTFSLALSALAMMLRKSSYNSAMKAVLINQIYFTSVQILPLFLTTAILFGSFLIGILFQVTKNLGLAEYFGRLLMGFVCAELSPFMTVLLIALRSSSAINAEIAVMKMNNELKTLEMFNINVINYLFLPRIINGVVSVVLLSNFFSLVVLTSGLVFSMLVFGMSLDFYTRAILNSVNFYDIFISTVKCAVFGFFVTLIPIRFGLTATHELTSIPVAVLNGMVRVFIAIVLIEVMSFILRYI